MASDIVHELSRGRKETTTVSGHHFALGTAPSTRWVGRSYAHFVLPTPQLTLESAELFDRAICVVDGWRSLEERPIFPITMLRWVRPKALLILAVVGFCPTLVTVSGMRAKTGDAGMATPARFAGTGNRRTRDAFIRITDAVSRNGGRVVTDEELSQTVGALQQRSANAVALESRVLAQQFYVDYRGCDKCRTWSGNDASHCRTCGHRFDSTEDLKRDAQTRSAKDIISQCEKQLTALGRGEGLFPDWPKPVDGQSGPPQPPPAQQMEGVIAR